MRRGIIIDNLSTYDDWGLILTSITLAPPAVKTKYVDLPIGDGSIDLTDALLGRPSFEDRKGSFTFDVLVPIENRAGLISVIGSFLHGRKRKIILPDDLDYFYYGRLQIRNFTTIGVIGKLEIEIVCEPYKYKREVTRIQGTVGESGTSTVLCINSHMAVIPTFTLDAPSTITFANQSYNVSAGSFQVTNIIFDEGQNILHISGAPGSTYIIEYQEGEI